MIICGYAGIGKSYLAHNYPGVMDLESTPFRKVWERYAECAVHYHKQGYLVLVSCHKELRETLERMHGISSTQWMTLVPDKGDKWRYMERYEKRGNTPEFIDTQLKNWDKWLDEESNSVGGFARWYIMEPGETLYDAVVRMAGWEPWRFCDYDGCPVRFKCNNDESKCWDVNPFRKIVEKWKSRTTRN